MNQQLSPTKFGIELTPDPPRGSRGRLYREVSNRNGAQRDERSFAMNPTSSAADSPGGKERPRTLAKSSQRGETKGSGNQPPAGSSEGGESVHLDRAIKEKIKTSMQALDDSAGKKKK